MRTWGRGRETPVSRGGGIGTEGFQGVNPIHDWADNPTRGAKQNNASFLPGFTFVINNRPIF